MPQPYPNPTGINQSVDVFLYANQVTNGLMGTLFLVACTVILFIIAYNKGFRTSDSLAVSFILSLILGSMLWALGAVQGPILMVFVIGAIASVLWSVFDSK